MNSARKRDAVTPNFSIFEPIDSLAWTVLALRIVEQIYGLLIVLLVALIIGILLLMGLPLFETVMNKVGL